MLGALEDSEDPEESEERLHLPPRIFFRTFLGILGILFP
jgi:hypothetical protein